MDDIGENQSTCNFTMLSKRLHTLFIQYILNGRNRAPREADLTFLTSTFQCGARTDRRALQSKFKSWAKRMVVQNHKLILTCSGKEIIPLEDSCDVVMRIHLQGHLSVGNVILQIQKQYTWSKKNFGMNREMVVSFILKNCSNSECIKEIENEVCRNYSSDDFIKDVIVASESRIHQLKNQINQNCALKEPSTSNNLSMACSFYRGLSPNICDIQYGYFNNLSHYNMAGGMPLHVNPFEEAQSNGNQEDSKVVEEDKTKHSGISSDFKALELREEVPSSSTKKSRLPRSYRKPKNLNEFQILLSAAEQFKNYPAILNDPKTKFLGSFGLVPKRICSKKTLMRFAKEKKRKKAHEIQHKLYRQNRKNLRDRNKLNKIKLKEQRDKIAYLDKFKRNNQPCSSNVTNSPVENQVPSFNNDGGNTEDSEIEVVKVVPKDNEPEIIEISSSDDEVDASTSDDKSPPMSSNGRNNKSNPNGKASQGLNFQHCPAEFERATNRISDNIIRTVPFNNLQVRFSSSNNVSSYPIFRPYFLPSNSKAEIAILPKPQCPPKILLKQDKTIGSMNGINIKAIKLHNNCFVRGKQTVLQPISNVGTATMNNARPLLASQAIRKLPNETNIYLMQKQPSGIVTMVPCRPAIAVGSKNAGGSKENETGRPVSVVPPMKSVGISKEFRTIRPITEQVKALKNQKVLEESKLFIDEEMSRLSKWIGMMKNSMAQTYFHLNSQKSKQKLDCQLNAGIGIIKRIRRKLYDIERLEEQTNTTGTAKDPNLIETSEANKLKK